MQEFRIKYQKGLNIYVEIIKANSKNEARYLFYMKNRNADILEIENYEEAEDGVS